METETMEVTKIDTLADVVLALREHGYHAKLTDDGVITGVSLAEDDGSSRDFAMLITEENGSLEFTCQLCTIGDLEKDHDENSLAALAWVFLAENAEIQPWALALINPDGELDSNDTIVLTDSVPLGDFSTEELASAMTTLLRALANAVPTYIK
ncbi:hypothetical protein LCGC14_2035620 [marine sediment metagenome]|uniref:YbjN domain-containing protein n=1 Tax=marine sediment metagenome TaxID=412755 RepID=A0A0F9FG05_9ZZZZ